MAAILLGNGTAPAGVPQRVLGRLAFGYRGDILPAGLVAPGIGEVTFLVGIALSAGLYAVLFRRSMAR